MTQLQLNKIIDYLISMRSPKEIFIGSGVDIESIICPLGMVLCSREDVGGVLIPSQDFSGAILYDMPIDDAVNFIDLTAKAKSCLDGHKFLIPSSGAKGEYISISTEEPVVFVNLIND